VRREVVPDDDPSMPLFFLSYARGGNAGQVNGPPDPNGLVGRFFDDLSFNVGQLAARMTGAGADPGFMDRSMRGGGRWTEELLHALGGCRIFIALLSPTYMSSKWCGMEWYAFSQRRVIKLTNSAPGHQTCIIPVAWAPFPHERIPECVDALQRFTPADLPEAGMAQLYQNEGILGLLRMRQDPTYEAVVWKLAQRIAEICYSHKVEPRIFEFAELHDNFQEH
jgi:TIR domain